jgi:hypothetical protein
LFTAGGTLYRWRDLTVAAQELGLWQTIMREAAEELACLDHAAATGEGLAPGELTARGNAFRRARRLLAVEELEAWLDVRRLTVQQWRRHLIASMLRERWADRLPEIMREQPPPGADVLATSAWTRAVCTGALGELADRLAADAAAEETEEAIPGGGRGPDVELTATRLGRMRSSRERLVARALSAGALAREVANHRLEWTRIACATLKASVQTCCARSPCACCRTANRSSRSPQRPDSTCVRPGRSSRICHRTLLRE